MSTKKTICITKDIHFYQDLIDNDNVYIEIEDIGECSFELWTIDDTTTSRAVVKISKENFEKMIDAYRSQEN